MNYHPKLARPTTCSLAVLLCALSSPLTADAQTSGALRGTVVDEDGQPIGDMEILAEPTERGGIMRPRKGKTKDDGGFTLANLQTGRYVLTFKKEGYKEAQQEVDVRMGESNRLGEIVVPKLPDDWVDPGAQAHFNTAMDAVRAEDYQAALNGLEKVVEQAPGFPEVHYNLGFVNEKLGNTDKAREHFQAALELRPEYFEANQAMGDYYVRQQDWSQAAAYLKKATEGRPDAVPAQYNYGAVTMNMGDMTSARAAFEKVLELDPGWALAHYQLGMISVSETKNEEAIAHLEKYLELDPEGAQAAAARGIVETLEKQSPEDPG